MKQGVSAAIAHGTVALDSVLNVNYGVVWVAVRKTNATGFTLVELMAVVAIAGVLLLVAAPAFQTQIQNSRISSAATGLLSSFMFAKSEAVGRNNFVTVCKRNTAGSGCVTTGGWEQGWIVFTDTDNSAGVNGTDTILQIKEPLAEGVTARGTTTPAPGIANFITYRPNGLTNLTATQTLLICDERGFGENARGLIVSLLGKASILRATETTRTACPI